jgi:hypothetical protein
MKRDWKIVVVKDSRFLGIGFESDFESLAASCLSDCMKLFMTRSGEVRYSAPFWPLGRRMLFWTSLQSEYFSTRKCNVGPRGVVQRRRLVFPASERENSMRWETPRGPAMVMKSRNLLDLRSFRRLAVPGSIIKRVSLTSCEMLGPTSPALIRITMLLGALVSLARAAAEV